MERSDERLSTRDIASPSGAETDEPQRFERDDAERERNREAAFGADAPAADTAAVPPERTDRDYDDGGAVAADRTEPVGDGDVVTDEPAAGRGPSRESIADTRDDVRDDGDDRDDVRGDTAADASAPAAAAAAPRDTAAADRAAADTGRDSTTDGGAAPLLADADGFQSRWEEIQVRFVDEPRGAVEDADALVATVMQRLAESFAQERERLEAQWGRGEDISTEDLRVALQRYRSFFQRLLAT
jgi:hypothetical protein